MGFAPLVPKLPKKEKSCQKARVHTFLSSVRNYDTSLKLTQQQTKIKRTRSPLPPQRTLLGWWTRLQQCGNQGREAFTHLSQTLCEFSMTEFRETRHNRATSRTGFPARKQRRAKALLVASNLHVIRAKKMGGTKDQLCKEMAIAAKPFMSAKAKPQTAK